LQGYHTAAVAALATSLSSSRGAGGTIARLPPSIEIPPPDSAAADRPPSPNSRLSLVSPLLQQSDSSDQPSQGVTVDIRGAESRSANETEQ